MTDAIDKDAAVLRVDLGALAANYKHADGLAGAAETAAVVKADGYGLGMAQAADTLWAAGCRTFFVAQAGEGRRLRGLLPEAVIYVLNGLPAGAAADFAALGLRPCLTQLPQIEEWQAQCRADGPRDACLFVDTGFNRLGLSSDELADLADRPDLFDGWQLSLIASHLACADTPEHPMNAAQLEAFRHALALLPEAPASLAGSGGLMLGPAYHFDLVRPGILLYGGAATGLPEDAAAPVAELRAPLLQIRRLSAGDSVGYGATFTAAAETTIGIVALGYADGLARHFGNQAAGQVRLLLNGRPVPVIGRVSMDSLAVDLTDLPAPPQPGDMVEVFGRNSPLDGLAQQGRTISYELLTSLGSRYKRDYVS